VSPSPPLVTSVMMAAVCLLSMFLNVWAFLRRAP
jgi:hypothetical protein